MIEGVGISVRWDEATKSVVLETTVETNGKAVQESQSITEEELKGGLRLGKILQGSDKPPAMNKLRALQEAKQGREFTR